MQNNAKIGGILSIISGAVGVIWLLGVIISLVGVVLFFGDASVYYGDYYHGPAASSDEVLFAIMVIYAIVGGFFTLVGVLGIVGGVFALRKKNWGLALAGAIGGTLVFFPCGIPAIVFIAMGKAEFEGQSAPGETVVS